MSEAVFGDGGIADRIQAAIDDAYRAGVSYGIAWARKHPEGGEIPQ